MANPLDWLAGELERTDNILGSGLAMLVKGGGRVGGSLLRGGGRVGGSLLRGAGRGVGRGVGALRDRMSGQDSGVDSGGEDDSFSPKKIPSGDGAFGNSEEILNRLINIEDILRGMSELATESNQIDVTAAENDRQAQEAFHRLFEQQSDEPDTPSSPVRVEEVEEKKSGGIFSRIFSGLSKFAGLFGGKGKLLLGIGALAAAGTAAYKLWDWLSGDNPDSLISTLGTTLREGFVNVAGGILDAIKEKIGTALSSLNWQEALRLAAAVAAPAAAIISPLARATAATMDFGGKVGSKVAGAGGKLARFMGFGKTAAGPVQQSLPGLSGKAMLEGLSNPAAAKEAVKGTSVLSRIGSTVGNLASRAPGLVRVLGTAAKWGGRVARPLAVAWDMHKLRSMEDESARTWQKAAIGLGIAGLAATAGIAAIVATGGLATPLVLAAAPLALGLGSAFTSIYAGRKESAAAAAAAGDSPTRMGEPETDIDPGDKEGYLHQELAGAGYSYNQSAGIIENLRDESGLDQNAEGDKGLAGGSALGIAQWRGGRKDKMLAYAADHKELSPFQAQVGFLIEEMKDMKGGSPADMPPDYAGAHNWMLKEFERPSAVNVEKRWVDAGTPAPGATGATANLYAGGVPAGTGALLLPAAAALPAGRDAAGLAAEPGAETPTSITVGAPNVYNDNRVVNNNANIFPPSLNARDDQLRRDIQGMTPALT